MTCIKAIEASGRAAVVTVSVKEMGCTMGSFSGSVPAWDMSFWDRASFLKVYPTKCVRKELGEGLRKDTSVEKALRNTGERYVTFVKCGQVKEFEQ